MVDNSIKTLLFTCTAFEKIMIKVYDVNNDKHMWFMCTDEVKCFCLKWLKEGDEIKLSFNGSIPGNYNSVMITGIEKVYKQIANIEIIKFLNSHRYNIKLDSKFCIYSQRNGQAQINITS